MPNLFDEILKKWKETCSILLEGGSLKERVVVYPDGTVTSITKAKLSLFTQKRSIKDMKYDLPEDYITKEKHAVIITNHMVLGIHPRAYEYNKWKKLVNYIISYLKNKKNDDSSSYRFTSPFNSTRAERINIKADSLEDFKESLLSLGSGSL